MSDVNLLGNYTERVGEVTQFTFGASVYCLQLSIINNTLCSHCMPYKTIFSPSSALMDLVTYTKYLSMVDQGKYLQGS